MKKVFFRVRRIYFDQIVSGEKKYELRAFVRFWKLRLLWPDEGPEVAVFWCGKRKHCRRIKRIVSVHEGMIPKLIGHKPSEQGKKDLQLDIRSTVIAIELGEEAE